MSEVIDESIKVKLEQIFSKLVSPVKLLFFTQQNACPSCARQRELLEELSALSEKIKLEVYDFVLNSEEAISYQIDKIPATAVIGEKNYGIRFYGLTFGYEFDSLLESIIIVSTGHSGLKPQLEGLIKEVSEPVHMQVFVTLTCPYCPEIVRIVHQFALINNNIQADIIESSEFPQLVQRYNVYGVPKTVINETHSFEGTLTAEATYLELLKAVNPEKYRRLEETIQGNQELYKIKTIDEKHEYEVIIVGGGPAAMTAAIYCSRKGLDVALIAKKLGGQVTYTGDIENYLGLPNLSGEQMTKAFSNHLERYPIIELLGVEVLQVKKVDNDFIVDTEKGKHFKAKSIIYCAGKEYLRLGVPGENSFIGKGIGFCATCDAPLYKGKRVAVVGGGNSAFTAIRDLLNFATEIHLIHRRKEFRADIELVNELVKAKSVFVHTPMVVSEFLGKDNLTGVRLESIDSKDKLDLNIDGVFLEIGLAPNTDSLKDLIELNELGEVPTDRFQSTSMKGLFAAGDVTDVSEKQICIAVGQGAMAALTAHKYLVENKLTKSKIDSKELWT